MNNSSSARASTLEGCTARIVNGERVAAITSRMPAEPDLLDTADIFGLLADPGSGCCWPCWTANCACATWPWSAG